nr:trehalase family glycosidase [Phytoactinopolyspora alkaliphila]
MAEPPAGPPLSPRPAGWNTWDVRYHTGMSHLPSGLRLRFGLAGSDGTVFDGFTWRHGLVRLGHHTVDGRYAHAVVSALDTSLDMQFAGGGDVLDVVASVAGDQPADLVVVITTTADFDDAWRLDVSASVTSLADDDAGTRTLIIPAAEASPLTLRLAPAGAGTAHSTSTAARVASARASALDARLQTSGWLGDAGDAYVRAVAWNTIYAPDLGRVLTPTSRDFVCAEREGFYGTWALHTWDTFFTGLVAGWIDSSYARGIFGQILDQADEQGMLPNRVSDDKGRTDDRSQPPVGALTVLKAYLGSGLSDETRDRTLLSSSYDGLRRWHEWWPAARRGPFGLLAWGSDPVAGDPESATMDRTRRESGLDDSPMYDDVSYDASTHTMDLADVGLNALHVADTDALAIMADRLGHGAEAAGLRTEGERAREELHRLLWDAEHDEYRNRWSTGTFSEKISPTMLYPLLAGAPTLEQARTLVSRLLAPDVLGGDPPLPSAARNDPSFSTRYWRGRVWAPMVYLAVEGLRRYGYDDEAREISGKLLRLYLDEWDRHSHVRENYPVRPGEDVRALEARSDGLMSWGSLLAYLAFQELADPRPDGWRFAHPGAPAELAGIPLGDGRLSVVAADRLSVVLDKAPLLDVDAHVVISGYHRGRHTVRGIATAREADARIFIAPPPGAEDTVELHIDGVPSTYPVQPGQLVPIPVQAPDVPVAFHVSSGRPGSTPFAMHTDTHRCAGVRIAKGEERRRSTSSEQ